MKRVANRAFDALVATRSWIDRTCARGIVGSAAAIARWTSVSNTDDARFERTTNCMVPNVRCGFCVYGTIISGRGVSVRV